MKTTIKNKAAFTLTEIMLALGLMVVIGGISIGGFNGWVVYREQITAEAGLNMIAAAQRNYLLEHPSATYSALTTNLLTPYLPGGAMPAMPTGTTVAVNVFPPTGTKGSNTWKARDY